MLVAAVEDALQGGVEVVEGDLGEEAEAAEVHPEDGDGLLEEAARREERAVAAEHHEGVGEPGHVAAGGHEAGRGERAAAEGGGGLVEADPDVPAAQPLDEARDGGPRLPEVGPGEDADRVHGDATFPRRDSSSAGASASPPGTRCRKNSRLPSAPGTGEGQAPRTRVAEALRLARHVEERLAVQRLVLHDAPPAHLEAAHLELGLHEDDRLRPGREHGEEGGEDRGAPR